MLRFVIILAVIQGLSPALRESVEMVVHLATSGHLAHFEPGETDLGDVDDEHGCAPTAHHCGCCASQRVLPVVSAGLEVREFTQALTTPRREAVPSLGVTSAPFRPPIGA